MPFEHSPKSHTVKCQANYSIRPIHKTIPRSYHIISLLVVVYTLINYDSFFLANNIKLASNEALSLLKSTIDKTNDYYCMNE